jgi:hypothetical protein
MARTTRINGTPTIDVVSTPARAPRPTKAEKEAAARATFDAALQAALEVALANVVETRTVAACKKLARIIRIIGVTVLGLSVVHCTEAITLLTGSYWLLSALLAIGIDAGMVTAELAEILAEDRQLRRWSLGYIFTSITLSMGLNAYAFSLHAQVKWAGAALGIVIPILVLMLGRIASKLEK